MFRKEIENALSHFKEKTILSMSLAFYFSILGILIYLDQGKKGQKHNA
jgi:hypothetical protein